MALTTPQPGGIPDLPQPTIYQQPDIKIDILPNHGKACTEGRFMLRVDDTGAAGTFKDCGVFSPSQWQTSVGASLLEPQYDRSLLQDRVTLFIDQDAIAFELPKIFLTQQSEMFRAAFDSQRPVQFAEGVTQEMLLPEEDARDFLLLLRVLIQQPENISSLSDTHWPYPCLFPGSGYCCSKSQDDTRLIRPAHVAPPMFRLCAMLERLAFDIPESVFQAILNEIPDPPGLLVAPTMFEWAMATSLDNGYLQRYAAKLLPCVLRAKYLTSIEYYQPLLDTYPQLALVGPYEKPDTHGYHWMANEEEWDVW